MQLFEKRNDLNGQVHHVPGRETAQPGNTNLLYQVHGTLQKQIQCFCILIANGVEKSYTALHQMPWVIYEYNEEELI